MNINNVINDVMLMMLVLDVMFLKYLVLIWIYYLFDFLWCVDYVLIIRCLINLLIDLFDLDVICFFSKRVSYMIL